MVIFLIPLKNPKNCVDYEKVWRHLDYTLYSCTQQTSNDYHIFVGCNKVLPLDICKRLDKVTFVQSFSRHLPTFCIAPNDRFTANISLHRHHYIDKTIKRKRCINAAYIWANFEKIHISDFVMMDADDFISPLLVQFIIDNPNPIWIINKGIRICKNRYANLDNIHEICGSSVTIDADTLLMYPNERDWLGNHYVYHKFKGRQFIPFPATAYVIHDENYTKNIYRYRNDMPLVVDETIIQQYGIPKEYLDA
jgi:hypothetical protein